jgi:hypothetical protein
MPFVQWTPLLPQFASVMHSTHQGSVVLQYGVGPKQSAFVLQFEQIPRVWLQWVLTPTQFVSARHCTHSPSVG